MALALPQARLTPTGMCRTLRQLHMDTCQELNVQPAVQAEVVKLLDQLEQLLVGICLIQVHADVRSRWRGCHARCACMP